jgi:phosphatidylinositol alpha 1,6-mannosyltransferase
VLYVGRLAQEKRVDLLSDVATLDGVALAVVGDGEERDQLEADFEGRAHFTGYLYGEELAVAYASADVFAFTGTHETYGQVVTEAMASGLPVLVPNAGGVVDLVLDRINGLVCQLNPDDYAAKVAYLRDHPAERRRMADRACEVASTRPWERVMAELEDYYAEACTIHASQE